MDFNLKPGIKNTKEYIVGEADVTRHLGEDAPVFATPQMINWMEFTCLESIREFLPEGYDSVGAAVNVAHMAPTPMGMKVTVKSELTEVNGGLLTFKVEAYDEEFKIGEGTHKRGIIPVEKFYKKILDKAARVKK